jgi:endogenous inhibitor of DNA gyrase (YacG/DUF329 family)
MEYQKMICPTCRTKFEPAENQSSPFCSTRCQQVDLGRWLDERNSMPYIDLEADEVPEDEAPPAPLLEDDAD